MSASGISVDCPPGSTLEVDELRRRHAELEILYQTIRDLSSTLSVEQVLERLLARTLRHMNAEIGSILVMGSDRKLRIVAARGLPPAVVKETEMEIGEGISGHVISTGLPLMVDDVELHPVFHRRNHERYYTRTLIATPLVLG